MKRFKKENPTRAQQVARQLRTQILDDELYKPMEKLPSERILTEEFGVSRPVIREAIRLLISDNIVKTIHGSGTYVTETPGLIEDPLLFDRVEDRTSLLYDWYETRKCIETEVVRLFIENMTEESLADLGKALEVAEDAIKSDHNEFLLYDRDFHLVLARGSNNVVLYNIVRSLLQSMYYSLAEKQQIHWHKNAKSNALHHHRLIYEAIKERDLVSAVFAIRSHMDVGKEDLEYQSEEES